MDWPGMKYPKILVISALVCTALAILAMMLASCETVSEGVSDAYNPLPASFAPPMANTPDHSEGDPVPGETLKPRP